MLLIINTSSDKNIGPSIVSKISPETETVFIECSGLRIDHCIGCNYCWLKTPGECSIKDDYNKILKEIVRADQMWVISDSALGFIDNKGKKIFDRILPILCMNLHFKGGQMRHVMRYRKRTDIGLIVRGDCDIDYLNKWCKRAALNLDSNSLGAYKEDDLKEVVACMARL